MSKQKTFHLGTWPLQSTGSTDEYETDDYSPSEDSDDDGSNKARGGATITRTTSSSKSNGKKRNDATTNKPKSGKSRTATTKTSSAAARRKGRIELLSSSSSDDDDDERGVSSNKKSNRTNNKKNTTFQKKNTNSSLEDSDDDYETDDNNNEEVASDHFRNGGNNNSGGRTTSSRGGRRALGSISDNKSRSTRTNVARSNARRSARSTRSSDNDDNDDSSDSDDDDDDDDGDYDNNAASDGNNSSDGNINNDSDDSNDDSDDDPFANLSRFPSNKRRKLQNKNYDSDSEDDDDDDSDESMDLGRSRNAELAKRRKKANTKCYSSGSSSSEDGEYTKNKKKKAAPAKKTTSSAAASAKQAAAVKKKSITSMDDSDSDSSIELLGSAPRKNPIRGKSPQTNKAATTRTTRATRKSPARAASSSLSSSPSALLATKKKSRTENNYSCELLSSDMEVQTTRRSSRKQPPSAKPTSSSSPSRRKSPPEEQIIHDPSVRAASRLALEDARKARQALRAAQQYEAKEVVLPPAAAAAVPSRAATVEIFEIDDSSAIPSRPAAAVVAPATVGYSGPTIRLTLRYKNPQTNKDGKTNIRIKMDQPLQHLMDEFNMASLAISRVQFDGQNLVMSKTPAFYEMEDEDLVDVTVVVKKGTASHRGSAMAVETTQTTTIHVQQKGDPKNKVHAFQIKKMDPLSKLVNAYCKQYSLTSIKLEYNGRCLDPNKSPCAEGLPSVVHLDAVVPVGVGASGAGGGVGGGGRPIQLKFRVNGKSTDIETLSLPFKSHFQTAMDHFCTKRKVAVAQCKFIFDGESLHPNGTPEGLDLEGGEMIDVKLPAVPAVSAVTAASATARSVQATRAKRGGPAARVNPFAKSSSARASTAPAAKISIQTNRNLNSNTRQKTWKVTNTDAFSQLQLEYTKYYKSKGCKTVKFFFRNDLVQDMTRTFRDLGVGDKDMIYAMENGKAYKPV